VCACPSVCASEKSAGLVQTYSAICGASQVQSALWFELCAETSGVIEAAKHMCLCSTGTRCVLVLICRSAGLLCN
jgi:hypothetical protein